MPRPSLVLAAVLTTAALSPDADAADPHGGMVVPEFEARRQVYEISSTTYADGNVLRGQPARTSYQRRGQPRRVGQTRVVDINQVISDSTTGKPLFRETLSFVSTPKGTHPVRLAGDRTPIDHTVMVPRTLKVGDAWKYHLAGKDYAAKVVGTKRVTLPDGRQRQAFLVLERTRQPLGKGGVQEISNLATYARGIGLVSQVTRIASWDDAARDRPASVSFTKAKLVEHQP